MRAATLALAAAFAVAGCTVDNKCKSGTVLVTASFDAAARAADRLDVTVQLDQQAMMTATLPGPNGKDSGSIEVQFPHGYHAGASLQVSIAASAAGQPVAGGSATTTLAAGCSSLPVSVVGGGTVDTDMSMPDMLMLPVPHIASKPDLVGFTTTLDATASMDPLGSSLTFDWAVQQAPAGSAITTASLTSKTATKPAFDPDRGGVYKLALTVTTNDGRSATIVADVTVPTVPLFYTRTSATASALSLGPHVVDSDGTHDRSIGCDFVQDGGTAGSTTQGTAFVGHAFEPPPTATAAQALFVFLGDFDVSGNAAPKMYVGSVATNCTTNPPTRVDNNVFNDHFAIAARFSPDGTRIAYVDSPQDSSSGTYRLVTVAVDGVGPKHVVRSDGFFGFTPPIWLDNTTVAWLERDTNSFNPFTIYKAPDANAAGDPPSTTRATLLRCDPSTTATHLAEINQFEISPFGMIVAGSTAVRNTLNPPPLPGVSLYKLAAGDCSTTTAKVLASEPVGGLAWDFALSPDGLSILFSSTSNQAIPDGGSPEPQTDIFLVPSDGSAAAQKFVGDPLYDDISPRFVAGGRQLIWSQTPRHFDMGADTPAIMIANADGTHLRAFTPAGPAGETVLGTDTGANRGYDCAWIPGSATAGATTGVLFVIALVMLALRRRRRD